MCARGEPRGEDETIGTCGEPFDEFALNVAESRKTLERPDIEELIEEKRDRAVGWRDGRVEKGQHGPERSARVRWLYLGNTLRRRRCHDGKQAALGRRGCCGEVDVLRAALAKN